MKTRGFTNHDGIWLVLWASCLDNCLENYTEHRCIQTDGTDDHWSVAETWSEAQKLYANLANDRSVLMVSICDPVKSSDFISPNRNNFAKGYEKGLEYALNAIRNQSYKAERGE